MILGIYLLGCVVAFLAAIYYDLKIAKTDVKLFGLVAYFFLSFVSWFVAIMVLVTIILTKAAEADFVVFKARKD